jgi:hypothetical protein
VKYRIEWFTGARWETVAIVDQSRRSRRNRMAKTRPARAAAHFASWRFPNQPARTVTEVLGRLRAVPCPASVTQHQIYTVDPITRAVRVA